MEKKFVEREKLSKKARKALDNQSRVTWSMDPRAKKVESKKVYNRKRFSRAEGYGDGRSAFVM